MREVLASGRASVVLIALAAGAFAFNTVEMMPLGVLPQLAASFEISPARAGTLMSGYALVIALATVPLVHASRRLPQRALVAAMLVGLAACTTVFASTGSASLAFTSRFVTAAAHGLMWSLMAPLAVAQFSAHLRGRVLAVLSAGAALAAVVGVPGVTLLAGWGGWRPALVGCIALALVAGLAVAALARPEGSSAGDTSARAPTEASWTGFAMTIATVALSVTAVFLTITYLSLIATQWSVDQTAVSVALSGFGVCGFVAAVVVGRHLDGRRGAVLGVAVTFLLAGLAILAAAPPSAVALVVALSLMGTGAVGIPLTCQHLLFDNSPLTTPMALALSSIAFNLGVAVGGAVGGAVLAQLSTSWLAPVSLAIALVVCCCAAAAVRWSPPASAAAGR